MKTAICYFGIPRKFNENFNFLHSFFEEFDTFAHFWTSGRDIDLSNLEKNINTKSIFLQSIKDTRYHAYDNIVHAYESNLFLEHQKNGIENFEKQIKSPGWCVNPKNIVSMWNSMSKSVSLALAHANTNKFQYDRIILARTDVVPSKDFDINKTFMGDIHKFKMPAYHPGSRISSWVTDHIISMSSPAAEALTFLPQFSYHYFYCQGVPIIPEIMLGHHMKAQGMQIAESDLYYRIAYKFLEDDGKI